MGETLTVGTSGIDDADGMSGAVFSYQWLANEVNIDTDIAGATDPTYTLVADDVGKAIRVRVSFDDDRNFLETLTSEATATVVTPLTAEFQDAPDKHLGTGFFTFVIAFSEPISIGYKTLRDDSLEVTNGSATKAKRVNGQSDLWEITVEPDSNAAVTVVLPITEDCGAPGAVCSRAGGNERRPLSNRSELTVPGPAAANTPATGAPSISGTAQVGETLTVDTSGIADADGMSRAVYSYQWLANDAETTGATSDTYTLVADDVGKAVKVRVIFNDDDNNEETLTSEATAAVAAETAVPGEPEHLNVSPHDAGALDLYWEAPGSDGGSPITGYKVQWKRVGDSWDTPADVFEATVSRMIHTITGLTDGVEYAVRVIAVNDVGDGPPSDEATGTPRETTPPVMTEASVRSVKLETQTEASGINSHDEPVRVGSVTVEVTEDDTDPDDVTTSLTVTWRDAKDCSSEYNAYFATWLHGVPGTEELPDELQGYRIHLGSATSDASQITKSLSNVEPTPFGLAFEVEVYCGTYDSGRYVRGVYFSESILARPEPGTYSSEPGLTSLTVNQGTLTPEFDNHTIEYTVPDVPNASDQITVAAAAKTGLTVGIIPWDAFYWVQICSPNPWECARPYEEEDVVPDADADTDGYQLALDEGKNRFIVVVWNEAASSALPGEAVPYSLTVTRAPASTSQTRSTDGESHVARNSDADGSASSKDTSTSEETASPELTVIVSSTFMTLTYNEALNEDSAPSKDNFTVTVNGATATVNHVSVSGSEVTLRLASEITSEDTVTVSYTVPTDLSAPRIKDLAGNAAESFSDQDVENNTPPPANAPATGQPTISGTARVGETLTVDTTAISDADGLDNTVFAYQWLADDAHIAGATDPTYTLMADDVGKAIKVQVTFIDDRDFEESLASEATEAVVAAATSADDGAIWSATMTVGGSGTYYGYSGYSETGELSPKEFSLEGSDYTVWVLGEDDGGQAYLILNQEIPVDFVLQLGAVRLASKDAETQDLGSAYHYQWDVGTVSLSVGDKVEVGLRTDNNPATGAPSIGGTAQVGETLTAVTSGIEDVDGLGNVAYTYQWIGDDAEITGATDPTYTLVDDDAGLTIKVQVSFFDDKNNPETLTSAATTEVLANVPGSPEHLNVSLHDTGALDVSWEAPATDGGSAITEYRVQWKETAGNWDAPADVSEETATGTTHTITGLTDGVEYAVRIIAVNDIGEGPPSDEATGTPGETTPPELATATVDGTTLTLTYDEDLDENSEPSSDAFSVAVGGTGRAVDGVSVSGSSVILTLGPAVVAEETVTVSYAAPTDAAAPRIQDDAGNPAASFSDQDVENNTPPPANTPATGAPTISGTAQVGKTLTVDTTAISDADGLDNVGYSYQWLADDTEVAGATSSSYTLVDADKGKTIQVKVSFRDDKNNPETLTSAATAAVEPRPNSPATGAPTISGTVRVGKTLTVETSAIDDADGMSKAVFTYQWLAGEVEIAGATDSNYTLVDDDAGKTTKVQVSFTDDEGNEETLTSEATAVVAAAGVESSIWASTLTVERWGTSNDRLFGFDAVVERGELDPPGFSHDDVEYRVEYLILQKGGTNSQNARRLHFKTVTDLAAGSYILYLDGTPFPFEASGTEDTFIFSEPGLKWRNGDEVEVSLTLAD